MEESLFVPGEGGLQAVREMGEQLIPVGAILRLPEPPTARALIQVVKVVLADTRHQPPRASPEAVEVVVTAAAVAEARRIPAVAPVVVVQEVGSDKHPMPQMARCIRAVIHR